jgi:hypothetical protein
VRPNLLAAWRDAKAFTDAGPWPVAYALTQWTAAAEARIGALVRKAMS